MKPYVIEDRNPERVDVRHLRPKDRREIARQKILERRQKRKADKRILREHYD